MASSPTLEEVESTLRENQIIHHRDVVVFRH
jgi:hypothetical protein